MTKIITTFDKLMTKDIDQPITKNSNEPMTKYIAQ